MWLRFTCPCGRRFRTNPKNTGKRFVCQKCWQLLDVPQTPPALRTKLPTQTTAALRQSNQRLCQVHLASVPGGLVA